MIWVRFSIAGETVFVKVPEGRDVDVLNLADKRFGFNGTEEQRIARERKGDEMLAKREREKRDARD